MTQRDDDKRTVPDGYGQVEALLGQARQALDDERIAPSDWVTIREAMPDRTPRAAPWLQWALMAGGAVAAAVAAVALVPGTPSPTASPDAAPVVARGVGTTLSPPSVEPRLGPALATGVVLKAGTEVKSITGFGRHALKLSAGSEIRLDTWRSDEVRLTLITGTLRCDVQRANAAEVFAVTAGETTVRVVGTTFEVSLDASGAMAVQVIHGEVAVRRGDVEVGRVRAGNRWTGAASVAAAAPQAPAEPIAAAEAKAEATMVAKRSSKKARKTVPKKVASTNAPDKAATAAAPTPLPVKTPTEAPPAEPGPKTVDRTIEASDNAPQVAGGRTLLTPVVGLIRGGQCGAAKSKMRGIYKRLGADRTPPDLFYLMAYCNHVQGKHGAAKAFFMKYRYRSRSRSFKVPSSPEETLPVPSASQLQR